MKNIILILVLLFSINANSQVLFDGECGVEYFFESNTGEYLDFTINKKSFCDSAFTYIADFNMHDVKDMVIVYENNRDGTTTELFRTLWVGKKYVPTDTTTLSGYNLYVDGEIIKRDRPIIESPTDFGTNKRGSVNLGLLRIIFSSRAPSITIRIQGNSSFYTNLLFYVHCTEQFTEIIKYEFEEVYLCYEPTQDQERIVLSCDSMLIVDSVYTLDQKVHTDTLLAFSGDYVKVDVEDNVVWEDGEVGDRVEMVTEDELLIGVSYDIYDCPIYYYIYILTRDLQVFAPNAFTPNGDGANDVFRLEAAGETIVHKIVVYDRWGGVVIEGLEWDGTGYGVGVYVWVAEVSLHGEKTILKGDITLIR